MAKNRGRAICADSRSDTFYVLTFEYDDGADGHDELRILRFNTDESWADFIVRNRKGLPLEVDFDIAIGPSVDGDIGHILDLYGRSSGDAKKELIDSLSDNDSEYSIVSTPKNPSINIQDSYVLIHSMKSVIPYTPDEVLVFVTRGFAKVHKITISEAEGFFAKYGVDKAILDHPELYAHSGPDGWDYWISNRVSSQNGVNYPRPESYYDN